MKRYVIKSEAPIYANLKDFSTIINECLYGETISIVQENKNYFLVKSNVNNYKGWIRKDHTGILPKPTHKVDNLRTVILSRPHVKSLLIKYLHFNSEIKTKNYDEFWYEVIGSNFKTIGFTPKKHLKKINKLNEDWVTNALKFVGTPYKWGGRTSFGLDCSALVELSLQANGINCPRDTTDQINFFKTEIKSKEDLKRGDLVFWNGHVAIMINRKELLHANAFNMLVNIELFELTTARLKRQGENVIKFLRPI